MLQSVGILTIAAVCGASGGLHIGRTPRLRTDRTQEGGRMKSTCTNFYIVGLLKDATLPNPIILKGLNESLERFDVPIAGRFHESPVC